MSQEFQGKLLNASQAAPVPSEVFYTTRLDAAVRLRTGVRPPASEEEALTVHELFVRALRREGASDLTSLVCKRDGVERRWTFLEYYTECVRAARSLIALGVQPGRAVALLGFNAPEWFFGALGGVFAGAVMVGIYTTNTSDACRFILENSSAQVLFVENDAQLNKVLALPAQSLAALVAIVQYSGTIRQASIDKAQAAAASNGTSLPRFFSWAEFKTLGESVPDNELVARLSAQAANQCAALVYTSGTTGEAKGCMLSQDNLTWTSIMVGRAGRLEFGKEVSVSFLPLSHTAALIVDVFVSIAFGVCVNFARPDAFKGTLLETIKEVQPTYLFAVPRVWEKMQDGVQKAVASASKLRQAIFDWAMSTGLDVNNNGPQNRKTSLMFALAERLVFSRVREQLGLSRCVRFVSAAAPISHSTLRFFLSLNIPLTQVYGLTECSGPQTVELAYNYRLGSTGNDIPGTRSSIDHTVGNEDDQLSNEEGEVLIEGRNVFMGYLNNEEETIKAFTSDGRLRTGDRGIIDKESYLFITGRIKELIIGSGGENIAPLPLESRIREALPSLISNAMAVGDHRKFLAVLLTLRVELDPDTLAPTERLAASAREFLERECGASFQTIAEVLACVQQEQPKKKGDLTKQPISNHANGSAKILAPSEQLRRIFDDALTRANIEAPSNAHRVHKWTLLPREFSIGGGELGPTMKLRRGVVLKMYADAIERMYAEAEDNTK